MKRIKFILTVLMSLLLMVTTLSINTNTINAAPDDYAYRIEIIHGLGREPGPEKATNYFNERTTTDYSVYGFHNGLNSDGMTNAQARYSQASMTADTKINRLEYYYDDSELTFNNPTGASAGPFPYYDANNQLASYTISAAPSTYTQLVAHSVQNSAFFLKLKNIFNNLTVVLHYVNEHTLTVNNVEDTSFTNSLGANFDQYLTTKNTTNHSMASIVSNDYTNTSGLAQDYTLLSGNPLASVNVNVGGNQASTTTTTGVQYLASDYTFSSAHESTDILAIDFTNNRILYYSVTNDITVNFLYQTDVHYTVTFMNGSDVYEEQVIDEGATATKPTDPPIPSGKDIFTGWYLSGSSTPFNFSTAITEDTTLYAQFEISHTFTVLGAGFGTANTPIASSEWVSKTGGEIHPSDAYAYTINDYSNTTGVGVSVYTNLRDVTALKIKVGDHPEATVAYSGAGITRYVKSDYTIGTTSNPSTDILKLVMNSSSGSSYTFIPVRFYNINEDITMTFVHNMYTMSYVDNGSHTTSLTYTKQINGYTPSGNSYSVPTSSLIEKTDGKYVNMHAVVDSDIVGIKLSDGLMDVEYYYDDAPTTITNFGNIEVSYANNAFDISFINLNSNVTVTALTERSGYRVVFDHAGDCTGGDAISAPTWHDVTGGNVNVNGILSTPDDPASVSGIKVTANTSIGVLKQISITTEGATYVVNKTKLSSAIDEFVNRDGSVVSEKSLTDTNYRFVKDPSNNYFEIYFYHVNDNVDVNIEYDDVTITFEDPYSGSSSFHINEYPDGAQISTLDSSITINSGLLKYAKEDSIQIGITPKADKMDGIIVSDGTREYVFTSGSTTDYTFGRAAYAKSGGSYFIRFYYLNTDVSVTPRYIETVSATQKMSLNADGTTSLDLALTTSPSVNTSEAFLRIDGNDIPFSNLRHKIDYLDNHVYTYRIENIAAKNVADEFNIQFFKNSVDTFTGEHTISVRNYLNAIIDGEYSDTLKNFAKSMKSFDTYVRKYFDYNTGSIDPSDYDEDAKEAVVVDPLYDHLISGSTEGISAAGQTLILKYFTSFKVYFTLDGSHPIGDYSFRCSGGTLSPVKYNDTTYYVNVPNLAAPDLGDKHSIVVKLGEEGDLCVDTSALAYANIVINNTSEDANLVDAMKAMYDYYNKSVVLKDAQTTAITILDDIVPYNGEKIKIAFIGDSITYGYLASNPSEYSYPARLRGLLNNRYEIANFGVSASYAIAADSPYNYRADKPQLSYKNTKRYQPSIAFEPDVVIIMLGTNDIRSITAYGNNAVNAYKEAMVDLIETYEALPSVSRVYVANSIIYCGNTDVAAYSDGQLQAVQAEAAALAGVDVIDIFNPTRDLFYNNQTTYYNSDKLHPNDAGYLLMAQTFYDALTDLN